MAYNHTFEIDCSLPVKIGNFKNKFPPSLNHRLHWAQRSKLNKLWRHRVYCEVGKDRPPKPLDKCHAIITRYSTRELDFDNMITSNKPIVDGLVDAKVMKDDSVKHFSCDYRFMKCKRGDECLVIQLIEQQN